MRDERLGIRTDPADEERVVAIASTDGRQGRRAESVTSKNRRQPSSLDGGVS